MVKKSRFELSHTEKIRRSIYLFLRDQLEHRLVFIALENPYRLSRVKGMPYPYVEPGDLRPKKKEEFMKDSFVAQPFFIIFCEGTIDESHQKYIRFSEANRVKKENLQLVPDVKLSPSFYTTARYFERENFFELLEQLLDVDYCLLIQSDGRRAKNNSYCLTHFHVKIDLPIAEAAESLGRELRYISKNLYEKGDRYAEILQQKLFEYYGCHHQGAGGRRSAALIAAQYLKGVPYLSTVYVSSAETRTLTCYSERGVGRYAIVQIEKQHAKGIVDAHSITETAFRQGYVLGESEDAFDVILFVRYERTEWARPPEDGRLRILKPDYSWLSVESEMVLPKTDALAYRPLLVKWVYRG
jgi:hypothetical protein